MDAMGSRRATELLQLPVRLHGIRLGRPVDLLLDASEWRVLGFVVLCGDESLRFLVFAAADVQQDAIAVPSALLLLEDVGLLPCRARDPCATSSAANSATSSSHPTVASRRCWWTTTTLSRGSSGGRRSNPGRFPRRVAEETLPSRTIVEPPAATLEPPRPQPSRSGCSRRFCRSATGSSSASSAPSARSATASTSPSTTALLHAGLHYLVAATCSFLVAVTSNYTWNRLWTFRDAARARRRAGDALLRRLARRRSVRTCSCSHLLVADGGLGKLVGAGDRDRARDAAQLHREQALVVPPAASSVAVRR